eukprot:gnl/TRDRNA2_/TRDRNA2_188408_c0_seq1.p1 gnl/TRDRNA2_/TRDRNA2_188408_c0~~gnl/TRDRNA2_/TRDRNA2_188408_c0_seq1.p1  ORF type:complete len:315 (-),score=29.89 gnl/TRDRNA2_/TRDRNA2_188408_c0_seq1:86-1030(-)
MIERMLRIPLCLALAVFVLASAPATGARQNGLLRSSRFGEPGDGSELLQAADSAEIEGQPDGIYQATPQWQNCRYMAPCEDGSGCGCYNNQCMGGIIPFGDWPTQPPKTTPFPTTTNLFMTTTGAGGNRAPGAGGSGSLAPSPGAPAPKAPAASFLNIFGSSSSGVHAPAPAPGPGPGPSPSPSPGPLPVPVPSPAPYPGPMPGYGASPAPLPGVPLYPGPTPMFAFGPGPVPMPGPMFMPAPLPAPAPAPLPMPGFTTVITTTPMPKPKVPGCECCHRDDGWAAGHFPNWQPETVTRGPPTTTNMFMTTPFFR